MFRRLRFLSLALALACPLVPTRAQGFCRKTTASPPGESYDPAATGTCGDGPKALPLYWAAHCVEYRVIVASELESTGKLTKARARALVRRAAEAWTETSCARAKGGGKSPSIRLVDVEEARCGDGRPGPAVRSKNEVRFTAEPPPPLNPAVTTSLHEPSTGRLTDAQITVYRSERLDREGEEEIFDRETGHALRHELGHFLGIGHSGDVDALMYFQVLVANGLDLTPDDNAAICAAYPPDSPAGEGCAAAGASAPSTPTAPLALPFALAGLVRLLRRSRARHRASK